MDSNERKIVQELVTALGSVIPASDGYEPRTNLWNKYMAAKNLLAAAPQVVADERALPSLPKCKTLSGKDLDSLQTFFSAEQMREYARAALAAAPVPVAPVENRPIIGSEFQVNGVTMRITADGIVAVIEEVAMEVLAFGHNRPRTAIEEHINKNEWLIANLMKALRPIRDHAQDVVSGIGTTGNWAGPRGVCASEWVSFQDAADRLIRHYEPIAAAPVQAQEPVAAAISYWKGPTNSNGTPRECGDANIGRWLDYEPTTLKHGMAIKDRGDPDKRVKFLFDAAPVQPVAVPDGEEFGFKAVRLRRTAFLLGLEGAIPDNDKDLMDCMGAVLGMICREVERRAAPAAQGDAKDAINAELVAALKDITDDICERFDMDSSSTNPGIKNCVARARAAIAAKAAS